LVDPQVVWDPASFRDPAGSVFFHRGNVYRTINSSELINIEKLIKADFFKKYIQEGSIIPTSFINNPFKEEVSGNPYILEHEKISFITYPYEWSYHMLKDAALLTLSILKDCLENDFILKDGTAWNVTYYKGKMCFFDILSIEAYSEGQLWEGYKQFCQEFLYPLLVKAHKDIDFNAFFRGSLNGIDSKIAGSFFTTLDWRKPGIFKHVFLNSKLSSSKTIDNTEVKNKFRLPKQSLIRIIDNLYKIVSNLHPSHKTSIWQNYTMTNTYTEHDNLKKKSFISSSLNSFVNLKSVIDLGSNTGDYSLLAAEKSRVFACDIDSACIDQLYLKNKELGYDVTPLVLDLMNPSPDCGWKLKERSSLLNRLNADAFLALALIHHICIASNVPLRSFIEFLSSIAPQGVLEWVDKTDPMVKFLLRNRTDIFSNYTWENFEKIVSQYFKIEQVEVSNNGTRKLCKLVSLS
jgi:hypothetical protein